MRKIRVTTLASILLAFVVVAPAQAGQGKIQIAECWHFCIFIDFNLAVADELLRSDFVWHYGFARALAPGQDDASIVLNAGLSEFAIVHDAVFSHGDLVEIRWTASGVHTGELLGFPPTGCKIVVTGNDLFRIEKGQML